MSATQVGINPIDLSKDSIKLLTKAAASDAKHDFAESFMNVFDNFKKIGTTQDPDEVKDEHGTLHLFLSKEAQDKIHPDKFNPAIFPESGESETKGLTLNPSFGDIHTYTLHTRNINTPEFTGESLMGFLTTTFTSGKTVYVQQDAASIGIKDKLGESNPVSAVPFIFYFMNSREGQNDAAGKTGEDDSLIRETQGKQVKVSIQNEEDATKQIHYPSLDEISTGRKLDYTNNFNSIFNIEISPIIVEESTGNKKVIKTKRVIMYFRDKENKLVGSTNKGKAENAKGNLKDVLQTFYKLFTNIASKLSADKHSYWQSLQQKRGGDWLQALSTYDKARFGLTEDQNIILMTHDLIALAYALANGVSVLFTYSYRRPGGDAEPWILLFQNEKTANPKGYTEYINELDNLESALGTPAEFGILKENIKSYSDSREAFKVELETDITTVNSAMAREVATITGENISAKVQPILQGLFTAYFNYSYYMQMFPKAETFVNKLFTIGAAVTENEIYTRSKEMFTELRNKYSREIRKCMDKVKDKPEYASLKTALETDEINVIGRGGEKVPNTFGKAEVDTLTYADYKLFRDHLKSSISKALMSTIDTLNIDTIETDKNTKKRILDEIQSEIKAQERFVGQYLTIKKSIESYKIGTGGYDLPRIKTYSKKIKTKDLENINYFLKNLNPFVISVEKNSNGDAITISLPTNRFKEAIKNISQEVKDVFKNKQERSINDYSVFNYFIGQQIDLVKKDTILANLATIKTRLEGVTPPDPGMGGSSADKKRYARIKGFSEQFTNFINEVEFHLKGEKPITYKEGLLSDLVDQLHKLIVVKPVEGVATVGSQQGGETPDELKIILSFVSDLMIKNADGTYTIENEVAAERIINDLKKSIGNKLKEGGIRTNKTTNDAIDDVYDKLVAYKDDTEIKTEFDTVIQAILTEKEAASQAAATQAAAAAEQARLAREAALTALTSRVRGLTESIRAAFSTYTEESIEPESESDFVSATINDDIESIVAPEDAETTTNGSNFVQTTPASLYIDMITNVRENTSNVILPADSRAAGDFDKIIKQLGEVPEAEKPFQGGARRLLALPPGMNLPYLGWITLFFHACTLLEILQGSNDVSEGIDFPFLARQAQFLLAISKARYSVIGNPRGGSKTRKQKGAGGFGSPNKMAAAATTTATITTTPSRRNNRPVSYANTMNKIKSQEKQINSKINRIHKDYQLGRDCDALLTYFISNIEEVPGYTDASLMNVLGVGSSPLWLSSSISTINETYFNWGFDPSFKEKQYVSSTLPTLLKTTFTLLGSMPQIEFSNEGKRFIEKEIYNLISSLTSSIKETEQGFLSSIYKHILLNRLEEALQESLSRNPTFSQREAIYKDYYDKRIQIIELPFKKFEDLLYLIRNKLIPESVAVVPVERKTDSEIQLLRNIKEPRAEKIQHVKSLLMNDSTLQEKYTKQLQILEALKAKGNRNEFKQRFNRLLEFYENPTRTNLLSGGTRRRRTARLKSRSRTHKKI